MSIEANQLLTPTEVKDEFDRQGLSIAEWARDNGFPAPLVYRVLSGAIPKRGKSHEIAVCLGLKQGSTSGIKGFRFSRHQTTENGA